jgi:hypothetical protein
LLDGLSPELAFAIGKAAAHVNIESPEARMLIDEGLATRASYGPYLCDTPLGKLLEESLTERVGRMYPEPEPTTPEPEPKQPSAPTFTPDPEPVKPVSLAPCLSCGAPKCGLGESKCSDCKIDVDPPR